MPKPEIIDESAAAFAEAIDNRIDYFRKEFNLSYASAIGILTLAIQKLANECFEDDDDDDDEPDEDDETPVSPLEDEKVSEVTHG